MDGVRKIGVVERIVGACGRALSRARTLGDTGTRHRWLRKPPELESLESRQLLDSVQWLGLGDGFSWFDSANWQGNEVPGSDDDVTINSIFGLTNVVVRNGTANVNNLNCFAQLTIADNGVLALNQTATMHNRATLNGGEVRGRWVLDPNPGSFGQLIVTSDDRNRARDLTLRGTMELVGTIIVNPEGPDEFYNAKLRIAGNLDLEPQDFGPSMLLAKRHVAEFPLGSPTTVPVIRLETDSTWHRGRLETETDTDFLVLNADSTLRTLTLGSDFTVQGQGQFGLSLTSALGTRQLRLVNHGLISAKASRADQSQTPTEGIRIDTTAFENNGVTEIFTTGFFASYAELIVMSDEWENHGTIRSGAAYDEITLGGGSWTNTGLIDIDGGDIVGIVPTLRLTADTTWENQGTLSVGVGWCTFDGVFINTPSSDLNLNGTTLFLYGEVQNTGATFDLSHPLTSLEMHSGRVVGGAIVGSSGGTGIYPLRPFGNAFENTTIEGTLNVRNLIRSQAAPLELHGDIVVNGLLDIAEGFESISTSTVLSTRGSVSITGSGEIRLSAELPALEIAAEDGPGALTIGAGVTIRMRSDSAVIRTRGATPVGAPSIINSGLIAIEPPGFGYAMFAEIEQIQRFDNYGTIRVEAGANLEVNGALINNFGTLEVAGPGTQGTPGLNFVDVTIVNHAAGVIRATGFATVLQLGELGTTVSGAGSIESVMGASIEIVIPDWTNSGELRALSAGAISVTSGAFINDGALRASQRGLIFIEPDFFTNNSIARAETGGVLAVLTPETGLTPTWLNLGQFETHDPDTAFLLGGRFDNDSIGAVSGSNSGSMVIAGVVAEEDNLTLTDGGFAWKLGGGRLSDTTINGQSALTRLYINSSQGNLLQDVTANVTICLDAASAYLTVQGSSDDTPSLTLNRELSLAGAGARLISDGTQRWIGVGSIRFDASVEEPAVLQVGTVAGQRLVLDELPITGGSGVIRGVVAGEGELDGQLFVTQGEVEVDLARFTNTGDTRVGNATLIFRGTVVNSGLADGMSTAPGGLLLMEGAFINNARAQAFGGTFRVSGPSLHSDAFGSLIHVMGGVFEILTPESSPSWRSSFMTVDSGSLVLGGASYPGAIGLLGTGAGSVRFVGRFDLGGLGLDLGVPNPGGAWIIDGGRFSNGTLHSSPLTAVHVTANPANSLDGMSLDATLDLADSGSLIVRNGLALTGRIRGGAHAALFAPGNQTWTGTGMIEFNAAASNRAVLSIGDPGQNAVLTLGAGLTIDGSSLDIVSAPNATASLFSNADIRATGLGRGTNILTSYFDNRRSIGAFDGAFLSVQAANWANAGAINGSNGTISLGGLFSNSSVSNFSRVQTTVILTGSMNNAGATLSLNADSGSWIIRNGRINGGTLDIAGTEPLFVDDVFNRLNGVTVHGDLRWLSDDARVIVENGLTLNGIAHLDRPGATLAFSGTQTLAGSGQVAFTGLGSPRLMQLFGDGGALTVGQGMLIRGGNAELGGVSAGLGTTSIINLGTIRADAPGQTLLNVANIFTNNGTVSARLGGSLQLLNTVTNYAPANNTLMGGTWAVEEASAIRIPGSDIRINRADITLIGTTSVFENLANLHTNEGILTLGGGRAPSFVPLNGLILNAAGATLNVLGPASYATPAGIRFRNDGTIGVLDGALLTIAGPSDNALFGTLVGGTWNVEGNSRLTFSGVSAFSTNAAHVRIRGGSSIITGFQGLSVNAGTLELLGSLTYFPRRTVGGTFTNAGTLLLDPTPFTFVQTPSDVSISNSGIIEIGSGTTDLNAPLTHSGGEIRGAGNIRAFSTLVISGGALAGPGGIEVMPSGTLIVALPESGSYSLGRDFVNHGTTIWSGGDLRTGDFENHGTVTIAGTGSRWWSSGAGGDPVITNHGVIRMVGLGSRTVDLELDSAGLIEVMSGELLLFGGGVHTGDATIAEDATLRIGARFERLTHVNADSTISGPGQLIIGYNAAPTGTNQFSGSIDVGGDLTIYSDTNAIGGTLSVGGDVDVHGGVTDITATFVDMPGAVRVFAGELWTTQTSMMIPRMEIYGGILGGRVASGSPSPTIQITSAFQWAGGRIEALSLTVADGITVAASGGTKTLASGVSSGVAFTFSGMLWSAGDISLDGSADLFGGTIQKTGDGNLLSPGGVLARVIADEFLHQSAGATTIAARWSPGPDSHMHVQAGSVTLSNQVGFISGTTLVPSRWTLASGATLSMPGAQIRTNQADITINGPGSVMNALGGLTLNSGRIAYLSSQPFTPLPMNSILTNATSGLIELGGSLSRSPSFRIDNAGLIRVLGGTLNMPGGTNSGEIHVAAGATLAFAVDHAHSGSAIITGTGSVTMTGGTQTIFGTVRVSAPLLITGTSTTVNGAGDLRIEGPLTWNGNARMSGTGRTIFEPTTVVTLDGVNGDAFISRPIENFGIVNWTAGRAITDSRPITNRPGGNFNLRHTSGTGFTSIPSGSTIFINEGAFNRTGNSGASSLGSGSLLFDNTTGTVNVLEGSLDFGVTGGTNSSAFVVAPGAALRMYAYGTYTHTNNATISGAGNVSFLTGTHTINGTVRVSAPLLITGSSTTVNGAGDLRIEGPLTWNGNARMSGTGRTIFEPTTVVTLDGVNGDAFISRPIENFGIVNWTAGRAITDSRPITNRPGGNFNLRHTSGTGFTSIPSGSTIFINEGAFNRTGNSGASSLGSGSLLFDNTTGTVNVLEGSLDFGVTGGTNSSAFVVAPGAALRMYAYGTYTHTNNATISGAGNVSFLTGTHTINGTVRVSAPLLITNSSTTIGGAGDLRIEGPLTWNGNARMSGTGRTILEPTTVVTLDGISGDAFSLRTIENFGIVNHAGGRIFAEGPGWINRPGGTFNLSLTTGHAFAHSNTGATVNFTNEGVFNRTGNTGSSTLASVRIAFNNTGEVRVSQGTLDVNAYVFQQRDGNTLTGGRYTVFANSTLIISGAGLTTIGVGATVTLSGLGSSFPAINSITAVQGTFSLQNGRNFTIAGGLTNTGTLDLGTNLLTVNGNYTQSSTGVLALAVAGRSAGQFGRLVVNGVASLAGSLRWSTLNGFALTPSDNLRIVTCTTRNGSFQSFYGPRGRLIMTPDGVTLSQAPTATAPVGPG